MNTKLYESLRWRCIGPHRGGRVVAVAADPTDYTTFYFGSTGGGVWKTTDGGLVWRNVSDGYFRYASVGALQVAPSDPNVIYAGMGEATIRGNVSRGDGVYRSTDAGRSWIHVGLAETQNIGEIAVHPADPDIVYVAALGHVWGENPERGVYRSTDGGENWDRILFKSPRAGAVDLSMDPSNPRILYASIWESHRTPYSLSSGGPDSGLWRSFDGGDSWEEISRNHGLPADGVLGKIGVAASGAKAGRVYAIVEHEEGTVFRSDDYGDTWQRGSEERSLRTRAWYYHHIVADPGDSNVVWVLNNELWKSIDGGETFGRVAIPHVDTHDLWLDPNDPKRAILGCDGGACISFTGGPPWSTIYNQPTAEFYHVVTDNRTPYRVYGAQQDNTTMSVPSRSDFGAITASEWREIGGGEAGYIAVRQDNPNIVYAGSMAGYITHYDFETGFVRDISAWPESRSGSGAVDHRYRWQWTSPIVLSPHSDDRLYSGANVLFRTTDEGHSWSAISPDLTVGDPETLQPSGGPITKDNTGAETYATIFAVAESPVQPGVIWTGSDDGLIHVSRDDGATWANVNPPGLPDWALISIIEASPHEAGKAYVAATRYKSHDDRPYLFKTEDFGASWDLITDGITVDDFARVIREDPDREGLLFAGTERGIYVSFNDGDTWQSIRNNLPIVPIHDLQVKNNDLVVATHGRSFWVLDDISPLRQIAAGLSAETDNLYAPGSTYRWITGARFAVVPSVKGYNYHHAGGLVTTFDHVETDDGNVERHYVDAGDNPPEGALIQYYLTERPRQPISLTILTADGERICSFSSDPDEQGPTLPANQGGNRFVWDLRYPGATPIPGDSGSAGRAGGPSGPKAVPGEYRARLESDGRTLEQSFTVLADPRSSTGQDEYQQQFDLQILIRDALSDVNDAVNRIRSIRSQIEAWESQHSDDDNRDAATELKDELLSIEGEFIQYRAKARQDTINFPVKLNAKLAGLRSVVETLEGRPTEQTYALFDELSGQADIQLQRLDVLVAGPLADFNRATEGRDRPTIVPGP